MWKWDMQTISYAWLGPPMNLTQDMKAEIWRRSSEAYASQKCQWATYQPANPPSFLQFDSDTSIIKPYWLCTRFQNSFFWKSASTLDTWQWCAVLNQFHSQNPGHLMKRTNDRWTIQDLKWILKRHNCSQEKSPTQWMDTHRSTDHQTQLADVIVCKIEHHNGQHLREKGMNGRCPGARTPREDEPFDYSNEHVKLKREKVVEWI